MSSLKGRTIIRDVELSDLMFWAFRYAITRSSYCVWDVSEILLNHKDVLLDKDRRIICKEIAEYLEEEQAHKHQCDIDTWERVLDELTQSDEGMEDGKKN